MRRAAPAFPGARGRFTRLNDGGSSRLRRMAASIWAHQPGGVSCERAGRYNAHEPPSVAAQAESTAGCRSGNLSSRFAPAEIESETGSGRCRHHHRAGLWLFLCRLFHSLLFSALRHPAKRNQETVTTSARTAIVCCRVSACDCRFCDSSSLTRRSTFLTRSRVFARNGESPCVANRSFHLNANRFPRLAESAC